MELISVIFDLEPLLTLYIVNYQSTCSCVKLREVLLEVVYFLVYLI